MRRAALILAAACAAFVAVVAYQQPQPVPDPHAADIAAKVVVPTEFAVGDKVRCHGAGAPWDGRGGTIVALRVNAEGCHRVAIPGEPDHVIPPYYLTPLPDGW